MIGTIAYSCKQLMDEANKRSLLVGLFIFLYPHLRYYATLSIAFYLQFCYTCPCSDKLFRRLPQTDKHFIISFAKGKTRFRGWLEPLYRQLLAVNMFP